jgi:hypothetical protein
VVADQRVTTVRGLVREGTAEACLRATGFGACRRLAFLGVLDLGLGRAVPSSPDSYAGSPTGMRAPSRESRLPV